MLKIKTTSLIFVIFSFYAATSISQSLFQPNVIFGDDNRQEMYSTSPFWQQIGQGIAGKVSNEHIQTSGSDYTLSGTELNRRVCPTNKFADQITVPSCSGFLATPTHLITAGHCIKSQADCDNYTWVFGYQKQNETDKQYTQIKRDQVYRCKKIQSRKFENFGATDYAIIELDRPVENRQPLQLGFDTVPYPGMQVTSMGHPLGLPMKFIDGASVIQLVDNNLTIATDLDAFQGNSGSPVFDATTGVVIGITSHGHADHIRDPEKNCKIVRVCMPGDNCHLSANSSITNLSGEDVLKK
ncbi:MAG: hypothetical protein RJB66_466 [Pseudomonadota bacterium]|jgi:V8-like Glu-specific endopeptidase